MSPEQATSEGGLDGRSEVYSLGCVLYEMLAGEPPFTGPTAQALITKCLVDPVPAVRRLRAAVPVGVEQALTKALAKVPADRWASPVAFAEALTAPARPRPPSVAVLPFLNLSADPENEYFADGITEDVIAHLSKIRALKVISRTSVMAFKQREQSLREIGARLEAATLLEGSVRRVGDRVRIVAQLIDAQADRHLWAETYDRQLTDVFAIQTDVALHIASALEAELSPDEKSRLHKEPTGDLLAYQLYLQGRHCYFRYTEEGSRKGIEYFEQAIAKDPDYALAYAALAMVYTELGEAGAMRPDEAYARAKAASAKALALDPELGEAHCMLAFIKAVCDFDWVGAEQEFQRALELTPNNADTYDLYGRMCLALERSDDALAMERRVQLLGPSLHRECVVAPLQSQTHAAVEVVRVGIVGGQLQRPLELLLGAHPVEVAYRLDEGEHAMRFAELGVEGQRLRAGCFGSGVCLVRPHRPGFPELRIDHGEGRVRESVIGVFGDRLLEVLDPLATSFLGVPEVTMPALKIKLIGQQIAGGLLVQPGLLIRRQLGLERGRDVQRHVRLDGEHIRELTVIRLRPEVSVGLCVDELRHDPHPIADPPHAAFEECRGLESRPDLFQALLPLLERHHRRARDHLEGADLRQMGDDVFRDPVGEVLVLRVRAEIEERQDRDGRRSGGGRCGERLGERDRRRPAVGRDLGERLRQRLLDAQRHGGAQASHQPERVDQPVGDHRLRRWSGERRLAGEHLVQHTAKTVHVAATIQASLARGLLGTHVGRRPHRHPRLRH